MRKPRSDSTLKTLPEERQAVIAALLAKSSLDAVKAELAKDGIRTSAKALSEFWSWYQLREALRRREARVEGIVDRIKEGNVGLPEEKLWDLGQSLFGAMAIAEEDGREWYRTQRLSLHRRKLSIDERRVAALEAKLRQVQDAVKAAKTVGGLTPETLKRIEEASKLL
jgi:hypothetical protein